MVWEGNPIITLQRLLLFRGYQGITKMSCGVVGIPYSTKEPVRSIVPCGTIVDHTVLEFSVQRGCERLSCGSLVLWVDFCGFFRNFWWFRETSIKPIKGIIFLHFIIGECI